MKKIEFLRSFLPALVLACASLPLLPLHAEEHLGVVNFPVSCSPSVQAPFNRGVAILHSFWYEESEVQFDAVAKQDPQCAMAHWGVAMSIFHEIWERPDAATMTKGWEQMQKAQMLLAKDPSSTPREQGYVAAMSTFYQPGKQDFPDRIRDYSAAMAKLHADNPADVDAAAFYALSLLSARPPHDLSLANNRAAMAILQPLFVQFPDHPGVDHYITHACDNPAMASQGLAAAQHYEVIASSVPHGVHMPSHVYSRLGMWQDDIRSNRASVADSQLAEKLHQGGVYDQLHSDDFLMYAYLQSADDASAKALLAGNDQLIHHLGSMMKMQDGMAEMLPYYSVKLPIFYMLETRDWPGVLALQPAADTPALDMLLVDWAKVVAAGNLKNSDAAHAAAASWQKSLDQVATTSDAYVIKSTGTQIQKNEMDAWVAFAAGDQKTAFASMRAAADEQDKVGQSEVDTPAREMLGDMLLASNQPQEALTAYQAALKLSPGRLNGLYHAGLAAEAIGKPAEAAQYYSILLKNTGDGKQSTRPEFSHAKTFLAGMPAPSSQAD